MWVIVRATVDLHSTLSDNQTFFVLLLPSNNLWVYSSAPPPSLTRDIAHTEFFNRLIIMSFPVLNGWILRSLSLGPLRNSQHLWTAEFWSMDRIENIYSDISKVLQGRDTKRDNQTYGKRQADIRRGRQRDTERDNQTYGERQADIRQRDTEREVM